MSTPRKRKRNAPSTSPNADYDRTTIASDGTHRHSPRVLPQSRRGSVSGESRVGSRRAEPTYLQLITKALSEKGSAMETKEILSWAETYGPANFSNRSVPAIRSGVQNSLSIQSRASAQDRKLWMWIKQDPSGAVTKLWTLAGKDLNGEDSAQVTTESSSSRADTVQPSAPFATGGIDHSVPAVKAPSVQRYSISSPPPEYPSNSLRGVSGNSLAALLSVPQDRGEQADRSTSGRQNASDPVNIDMESDRRKVTGNELQSLEQGRLIRHRVTEGAERVQRLRAQLGNDIADKDRTVRELDDLRSKESSVAAEMSELEQRLLGMKQELNAICNRKDVVILELRRRLDTASRSQSDFDLAEKDLGTQRAKLQEVLASLGLS